MSDSSGKKEPIYLIDLMFMNWHFLVLQVILIKRNFASDKYGLNIRLDDDIISTLAIDFPKIKGTPPLEKMVFFRNFVGRCTNILVFEPSSQETDK